MPLPPPLIEVGFWADSPAEHSHERPHPLTLLRCPSAVEVEEIVSQEDLLVYLTTSAFVESVELAYSFCRFGDACATTRGEKVPELGCASMTDGVFVWPEGLVHYCRAHEATSKILPVSFLLHVKAAVQNWRAKTGRKNLPSLNTWTLEVFEGPGGGSRELQPLAKSWRDHLNARSPHLRFDEAASMEDASLFHSCAREAGFSHVRELFHTELQAIKAVPHWASAASALELMRVGTPFVIDGLAYSQGWGAVRQPWIRVESKEEGGQLEADASTMLKAFSPDLSVPTTWQQVPSSAGSSGESYAAKHISMPLGDALDAVCGKHSKREGKPQQQAQAGRCYLKDWHFLGDLLLSSPDPSTRPYRVPLIFANDMLNWHCDRTGAVDFRFCYCGSGGTSTPLHHDVLSSCSWSCNLFGWKLWLFIPPKKSREVLYDGFACLKVSTLLTDRELALLRGEGSTPCSRPSNERSLLAGSICYCLQPPGSAVFVPPGWHHEVFNLGPPDFPVVSINHNWWNEIVGLKEAWVFLNNEIRAAKASIVDCRTIKEGEGIDWEWEAQVQRLVKVNAGFSLPSFVALLLGRIKALAGDLSSPEMDAATDEVGVIDWNAPGSICAAFDDPFEAASASFLGRWTPRQLKIDSLLALKSVLADCVEAERDYMLKSDKEKRGAGLDDDSKGEKSNGDDEGWVGADVLSALETADRLLSCF